ncbi:MAG: hypothetical protein RIG61_00025 [Deltaproteobacteria bacterium]
MKKTEEFLYDVRIAQRHLREGAITKKEYDKYIAGLPDVEANSEPLIIEDENEGPAQELEESEEEEVE